MPDPISWEFSWPFLAAALVFGYLLGSIPFGLIITRLAGTEDLRTIGSGNIGATNVLRTGRKGLAAATLAGDMLKGTAAVLIAGNWGIDTAAMAGLGAFLGHLVPVWLRFRGGKGIATYVGLLLGFDLSAAAPAFPIVLVFGAIWIAVAALTRYSSLSALCATLACPIVLFAMGDRQLAELFALISVLAWIAHRQNIARLLRGQESKIGQ